MAKIKVFGGQGRGRGKVQVRTIVAASSQKRAAEILNIGLYDFRSRFSETVNPVELKIALAKPGVVFQASSTMGSDFIKVNVETGM